MKRIGIIVGTRPEIIKMAPVYKALSSYPVEIVLIFTGQHEALAADLFERFDMAVNIRLSVLRHGQTLNGLFSRVLELVDQELGDLCLDLALVHGDTTTAAASALACFNRGVPVGHVEAGLRTHDLSKPFPEEFNRTLIARLADLNFCPTEVSAANLSAEGIAKDKTHVTGNTIVDALRFVLSRKNRVPSEESCVERVLSQDLRKMLSGSEHKLVLVTIHRRENQESFASICDQLKRLLEMRLNIFVVLPVHKNPLVSEIVYARLSGVARVFLIEPPVYFEFVTLLASASLVLTDSGGIQEEACVLGIPLLVLRESTERPEVLESANAKMIQNIDSLAEEALSLLDADPVDHVGSNNTLGDGMSSHKIASLSFEFVQLVHP